MTTEMWILLIGGIAVLGIVAIPFIDLIKNKDKYRAEVYENEEKRLNDEGDIVEMHAEVVDMVCGVNTVGHKEPKALKRFSVTFKVDDGELMSLSVPEVFYTGFDIGLKGTLTLIDGQLSSFELDEDHE
jgi:hypothetical protein